MNDEVFVVLASFDEDSAGFDLENEMIVVSTFFDEEDSMVFDVEVDEMILVLRLFAPAHDLQVPAKSIQGEDREPFVGAQPVPTFGGPRFCVLVEEHLQR